MLLKGGVIPLYVDAECGYNKARNYNVIVKKKKITKFELKKERKGTIKRSKLLRGRYWYLCSNFKFVIIS